LSIHHVEGKSNVTLAGVAEIGHMSQLQKVVLPWNLDADAVASRISSLRKLKSFGGGNNEDSDTGLAQIAKLHNLEHLGIDGNRYTEAGLKRLRELPHLKNLSISGAGLTTKGLMEIKRIPGLRSLWIYSSPHMTDEGMAQIGEMKDLQTLIIDSE